MDSSAKSNFGVSTIIVSLVLAAVFATLITLGTWQMQRLEWKENLLANIDQRLTSNPVGIEDVINIADTGDDFEYQPVTIKGTFDHTKERHFFATHNGFSGYYIYTPFTGDFGIVFVNRGFVPFDFKDPDTRQEGQVKDLVIVTGLARKMLNEKPSSIVPENDPNANIYYWKDLQSMAQSTGLDFGDPTLRKFFIDADDTSNPGGFPQGGVTIIDLPNNHLQYAFTWYGLAATLFCIVVIFIFRRKSVKGKS